MESVKVQIQLIGALEVPGYAYCNDAGFDLRINDEVRLGPGQKKLVSCGIKLAIPTTYKGFGLFGFLVPRSSCGKLDVSLANTVGIIDSPYRGEIQVYLKNNGYGQNVTLKKNERITQMILVPYVKAEFEEVDFLDETERGAGGYGSSGSK